MGIKFLPAVKKNKLARALAFLKGRCMKWVDVYYCVNGWIIVLSVYTALKRNLEQRKWFFFSQYVYLYLIEACLCYETV